MAAPILGHWHLLESGLTLWVAVCSLCWTTQFPPKCSPLSLGSGLALGGGSVPNVQKFMSAQMPGGRKFLRQGFCLQNLFRKFLTSIAQKAHSGQKRECTRKHTRHVHTFRSAQVGAKPSACNVWAHLAWNLTLHVCGPCEAFSMTNESLPEAQIQDLHRHTPFLRCALQNRHFQCHHWCSAFSLVVCTLTTVCRVVLTLHLWRAVSAVNKATCVGFPRKSVLKEMQFDGKNNLWEITDYRSYSDSLLGVICRCVF